MRYLVTAWCEECGWGNQLERICQDGDQIWLICHSCELPITVTVTVAKPSDQPAERARA